MPALLALREAKEAERGGLVRFDIQTPAKESKTRTRRTKNGLKHALDNNYSHNSNNHNSSVAEISVRSFSDSACWHTRHLAFTAYLESLD